MLDRFMWETWRFDEEMVENSPAARLSHDLRKISGRPVQIMGAPGNFPLIEKGVTAIHTHHFAARADNARQLDEVGGVREY